MIEGKIIMIKSWEMDIGRGSFRYRIVDGNGEWFRGLGRENEDVRLINWGLNNNCCWNNNNISVISRMSKRINGKKNDDKNINSN